MSGIVVTDLNIFRHTVHCWYVRIKIFEQWISFAFNVLFQISVQIFHKFLQSELFTKQLELAENPYAKSNIYRRKIS